jgi:hypothetical protein
LLFREFFPENFLSNCRIQVENENPVDWTMKRVYLLIVKYWNLGLLHSFLCFFFCFFFLFFNLFSLLPG